MTPVPLQWQPATITRIVPRTPRVSSFFLRPQTPLEFRAGQHIDIRLSAPDGYQARRGYSIASAPEGSDGIELAIERLENGEVSPFFHEVAQVGDEVEIRGPLGGHFVWSVEDGGPVLLVAAGSGIAPLMAMIRHRAVRGSNVPMMLLLSARTWDDVIFRDELLALEGLGDGFRLAMTLTREPARRDGDFARRVDAPMMAEVLARIPGAPKLAFLCGSNSFVAAAAEALIECGVRADIVRTERYGV